MHDSQGRKAEIQELMRAGRLPEAGQRLQEICAGAQADAESWFFLGAVSGMQGDTAGAENCFRKALVLLPGFLPARFNLGIALRDQGRLDDARIELETVVAAQPGYAEACNALGYVYVRLEQSEDAERCFHAALAGNPVFPEALTNLGNVLISQERWSEGIIFYRRALQVAPGYADAALNLGRVLVAQGSLEEAITLYRLAIASNGATGAPQPRAFFGRGGGGAPTGGGRGVP
jgi:Flp pilus assembly protein TadD